METTQTQQQPMINAEPQNEHKWLLQLVGEWTYEADATMEPGKAPEKCTGTESVRSFGGLWTLAEGSASMRDGSPWVSMQTLGYNPETKRYVGTWIGSMMTHLWVYDGELDATGRVLTLEAEGPDFAGGAGMAKYRDVIEIKSIDHRVLSSHILGPDGNWVEFMRGDYRRTK